MKRVFSSVDDSLPQRAWKEFEDEKQLLNRSTRLEMKCDEMFNHFSRSFYGKNAEIRSITKNVRIFIRHQFIPKSVPQEKDYYLLTIEGHVLDPVYRKEIPFVTLFDGLTICIDRRGGISETFCYPNENLSKESMAKKSYGYTAKIASDSAKGINVHIYFNRCVDETSNLNIRYELSEHFLSIFPNILMLQNKSVSEKEILFTLWYYITEHNLMDVDRRCVRCDQALCSLLGLELNEDTVAMHSIKQRLIDKKRILRVGMSTETDLVSDGDENKQNLACDSKSQSVMFTVDYLLHPTSTDIDITSDTCCTPATFNKSGGKCFDMEMTLPRCHADIHAMETLKLVNEMTSSNGATVMNAALEKRYQECIFISKNINKIIQELDLLDRMEQRTSMHRIVPCEVSSNVELDDNCTQNIPPMDAKLVQMMYKSTDSLRSTKLVQNPRRELSNATSRVTDASILQTAHGYIDIGNDEQFNAYYNHVNKK